MKPLNRRALLLAAPFLASACTILPDRPYQEVLRYALEPRRQGDGWRGKGRSLVLLRTLRAPPALDVRGLRSIRPDGTEEIDFYAEWIAPPAEAAEQALRRWLMDARLFAAVLAPGSRANPDLVLEGELTRLVANRARGQAEAELNFVLISERESAPRVLGQMLSNGTAALPNGTLRPDQAAAAMNAALANAFASLEQALARYA
ncbi:MAG: membrane integrity-associated transporter subunit PqiC [Roseomonas sp.]|nr:membrane integrity-associated transporter subunit PqiC [Roseomonas sp.]